MGFPRLQAREDVKGSYSAFDRFSGRGFSDEAAGRTADGLAAGRLPAEACKLR